MLLLSESKNNEARFILAPRNYTLLYNRLETLLPKHHAFFAKPIAKTNSTTWYFNSNIKYNKSLVKSYDTLSDEMKDTVSDIIESIKPEISEILKSEDEFHDIYNLLFSIPDSKDIKIIETEYEPIVILTQWACKNPSVSLETDPVSTVINRPKPDRTNVLIEIKYSDGSLATDKVFYFDYKNLNKKSKTNKKGQRDLGKFKFESIVTVYDIKNDEKVFIHEFTIKENTNYNVVFPLFANAKVKIINQKKQVIPEVDVIINYEENIFEENSGKYGIFELKDLEVGKRVTITEKDNSDNLKKYIVAKNKNEFIFEILQPFFAEMKIKVLNQFDEIVPNTILDIEYEGKDIERNQYEHISDENGLIRLKDILVGSIVKAIEKENAENIQNYTLNEEENEFIFRIKVAVPTKIKFKLIDHKKQPVVNTEIIFKYNNEEHKLLTDDKGYCTLTLEQINDDDYIKTVIEFPKSRKIKKIKFLNNTK